MGAPRRSFWWLLLAILVFALSLRGPMVAVAPVLGDVRGDLGLSEAMAGLLTTIPVLCFGILAPLASMTIARTGPHLAVSLSLLGVFVGTVVRSAGGVETAFLGTVLIGAAITVGNVVIPVIIYRDFPAHRINVATGAYTAAMNVGSMVTSVTMAPLAAVVGWQTATASWASVTLIGLALWALTVGLHEAATPLSELRFAPVATALGTPEDLAAGTASIWRSGTAWMLTAGFAGQGFSYYALTAWLPSLLIDVQGQSPAGAGATSSLFQIFAVVGALGVPALATRMSLRGILTVVGPLWISLPAGLILAPDLWMVWCSAGGIAQGGGITLIFITITRLARDSRHARRLSTMVQGGGYVVAATGPVVFGAIHAASGGWTAPLLATVVSVSVLITMTALAAGRAR